MRRPLLLPICAVLFCADAIPVRAAALEIDLPPHFYSERTPRDRFTLLKADLESGRLALDRSNEKAFVTSLLAALDVPVTSQMLVFSNTSLQLRLISPANPRALYFNEEVYVGWVPGGRIEILSLDPELGAIFYIFDLPRDGRPLRAERSDRCMNCHVGVDTRHVPGMVIKSVLPGSRGGSLDAYRQEETGHSIPFDQRFGGWYLTGQHAIPQHRGNIIGNRSAETLLQNVVQPGERFDFARYPVAASDVLPQLLHEHQAGFVNRVVAATYQARTLLHQSGGTLSEGAAQSLDRLAREITRYLLFTDEVPLPGRGVGGDPAFKTDFLRNRRTASNGTSLKDFDLRTRLFQHRCSYMIYSTVFEGLPAPLKQRIFAMLATALNTEGSDPEYAYLPANEKRLIRDILRKTLTGLPAGW